MALPPFQPKCHAAVVLLTSTSGSQEGKALSNKRLRSPQGATKLDHSFQVYPVMLEAHCNDWVVNGQRCSLLHETPKIYNDLYTKLTQN